MKAFVGLLYVFLSIVFIGCGGDDNGDDNEWVGTWKLETVGGLNYEEFLTTFGFVVLTNSWAFHDDGTFDIDFTIKGFPAEKSSGTYSLSGSKFTVDGFTDKLNDVSFESGTWSIQGDILAITGDDGTVIGLRRK